jgi:hypothetical protein
MLEQSKNISRKCRQALLAALVALIAAVTGCDKKVAWRGVGTDSKDADLSPDQNAPRNVSNVEPR